MADEAAMPADEAASIADVAADEAAIDDDDIASDDDDIVGAGVTTTAGGVVVVVEVSSFLVQAAKDTAAARVTISIAVFIFLLGFKVRTTAVIVGNPQVEEPHHSKTWKSWHFQCLTLDYRRLKGFP